MKKNLFIFIILFSLPMHFFAMKQPNNNPSTIKTVAESVKKKKRKKDKSAHEYESDDGYDKEIRQQKKALIEAAATVSTTRFATRMFQCSLCPTYFNHQQKNVRVHILSKHSDNPDVRIKEISPECGVKRLIEVKDLGKIYQCTECEKTFKVPYYFRAHMKAHHAKLSNLNTLIEQPLQILEESQPSIVLTTSEVLSPDPTPLATQTEKPDFFSPEELEKIFDLDQILKNFE